MKKIDKLYVATKNKGKLKEIADILSPIEILSAFDLVFLDDIEETGSSFEENAKIKGETVSKYIDGYVIADDSGLVVEALNGEPGIYSARFAGENATDKENYELLLEKLKNVPMEDRNAKFVCVIALCEKGKTIETFTGECKGKIAFEPRGENGFGYDPVFLLDDGRTMAELGEDEKNLISHRRKALEKLKSFLKR